MSECCNGACNRKHPIRVLRSDLTGAVYALTRWRTRGGLVEAQEKHDVTEDVSWLMQQAWNRGWDACAGSIKGDTVTNPYAPTDGAP